MKFCGALGLLFILEAMLINRNMFVEISLISGKSLNDRRQCAQAISVQV